MAKIVKITESEMERVIECCLSERCELTEEHISSEHRTYSWGSDAIFDESEGEFKREFMMSLEDCAREALLLAEAEAKKREKKAVKLLSDREIRQIERKIKR